MIIVGSREDFLEVLKGKLPSGSWCVEIGVFNGDFSQMILDTLNPKGLTLIDPFGTKSEVEYSQYGLQLNHLPTAYSSRKNYENVLLRFGNKLGNVVHTYQMFSYDAVTHFLDESFDFIYIDASHLYEDVKRDLEDWLHKLKPSGYMCGHDYVNLNGFGVIQAVNEFCTKYNFEMIMLNTNGGDFALKRK